MASFGPIGPGAAGWLLAGCLAGWLDGWNTNNKIRATDRNRLITNIDRLINGFQSTNKQPLIG